ncbi:hypothetical protein CAPTEDRAFT_195403 [Capitella teleta]|uniref:Uncharacterized protein n=1 Tax=Capitella teleta TaxID=283909 RepID=R7VKB3_CAPTE|nr:hypothetical protein CAPTEDRAFT_195403 [Capitella teleta]|eukprot:ELU16645.1 hypothetical protein CAPTEDRAFT_195403 [Capitella teleta]
MQPLAQLTKSHIRNGGEKGKKATRSTSEAAKELIRKHINNFPRIPSHFCRAKTERGYLDPTLSIPKMHTLYQNWCRDQNIEPQKFWVYQKIFTSEFNLEFHHPKKDLCDLCEKIAVLQNPDSALLEQHSAHLRRKEGSRQHKEEDKKSAEEDPSHVVIIFDLEKVLVTPSLEPLAQLTKSHIRNGGEKGKKATRSTSEAAKELIRKHINNFPRIPSHFCRAKTERGYLDPTLSIPKMHTLYQNWCRDQNIEPQKFWVYQKIFTSEFNLEFHHPKKDLCDLCEKIAVLQNPDSALLEQHSAHLRRKEESRQHKEEDKKSAEEDPSHVVITFDLEKVLVTPSLEVSRLYYFRKLSTYC